MFGSKWRRIRFEIAEVGEYYNADGCCRVHVTDADGTVFWIDGNVEGNVPLRAIEEGGTIRMVCDNENKSWRWKYQEPMFNSWDF